MVQIATVMSITQSDREVDYNRVYQSSRLSKEMHSYTVLVLGLEHQGQERQ